MKGYIDRPHLKNNPHLERAVAQISKWVTPLEMDMVVDWLQARVELGIDANLSPGDAQHHLQELFGPQRWEEIILQWSRANQPLLESLGVSQKYRHLQTGIVYDGLESTDNPLDYEVIRL